MKKEELEKLKAYPTVKKGWLGNYYYYGGKKFERKEKALEFRAETMEKAGLKADPIVQKTDKSYDNQEIAKDRVQGDSEETPGLVILLTMVGLLFLGAGVFSLFSYWPDGGAEFDILRILVLGNGFGLMVFGIFSFGFAKIISLLSRIENNTRK